MATAARVRQKEVFCFVPLFGDEGFEKSKIKVIVRSVRECFSSWDRKTVHLKERRRPILVNVLFVRPAQWPLPLPPTCPTVLLSLFIQPLFYYTLHSIPFSSDKCTAPINICLQMTKHPNDLFIYQKNVTINPSIMFCYDTLSYVRKLVSCMNSLIPLTVHKDGWSFRFQNAKVAKTALYRLASRDRHNCFAKRQNAKKKEH